MIKSMTAFARAENTQDDLTAVIDIRSYNSKFLDIALHIPQKYMFLEDRIKRLVSDRLSRGRIEIKSQIIDVSKAADAFEVNEPKASAYYNALIQLKNRLNIDAEISLDIMANVAGIIKPVENTNDIEGCWAVVKDCISNALDELCLMRQKEGDFIAGDIASRLDYIEKTTGQIAKISDNLLPMYQDRLKERIQALTKGLVELDTGRIAQEAAFLADRSDISEEIARVASHINQFRSIMNSKEPSGRKLLFLLQEFNREFNTMGSKAGSADASYMIVDIKAELEKIREQLQNVE
ncbi:MAG: YicC/YloC family endoribonuclease [Candidatus Desulfaltia sp.]|nr:YicC/YloC family endoribonuclease [Candidatus Desulfaltia sp.]